MASKPIKFKFCPFCPARRRPDILLIDDPQTQTRKIASVYTNAIKRMIGRAVIVNTTFVEDKPKEGGAK